MIKPKNKAPFGALKICTKSNYLNNNGPKLFK